MLLGVLMPYFCDVIFCASFIVYKNRFYNIYWSFIQISDSCIVSSITMQDFLLLYSELTKACDILFLKYFMNLDLSYYQINSNNYFYLTGTSKGNLILYDHKVGRKTSILGKHNRKITCGCWSQQNTLALAGGDNAVTVCFTHCMTVHL